MAKTRQTGYEQNRTNPGEFGQNRMNRAKQGKKTGQKLILVMFETNFGYVLGEV